jgi:hypothetical protein
MIPLLQQEGLGELGDPLLRINKTSFIETGIQCTQCVHELVLKEGRVFYEKK